MPGRSLSAAYTSCTINFGCSAISLSRCSISSCVTSGLPPTGGDTGDSDCFDCAASSALSRSLNPARGKSRNSPAIRRIAPSRGSTFGSGASGMATRASTASLSCSTSFPLAIRITQPQPQILQAAELKLLDTALRAPERVRDFANRFVFREPHNDHARLIPRQPLDQLEQPRPPLSLVDSRSDLGLIITFLKNAPMRRAAGDSLRTIGNLVRCDPEKPRHKRHATPFEPRQILQRKMKDFRGKILRLIPIAHPPGHIRVNPLEVSLIQIGKPAPLPLSSLNQRPLTRLDLALRYTWDLQSTLRQSAHV